MSTATDSDLDFFAGETEDHLRQQMTWLGEHAGLDHGFFARMLRAWRDGKGSLGLIAIGDLAAFWYTIPRVFSFRGSNEAQLRQFLEHPIPHLRPEQWVPEGFVPPWTGSTLRAYLESRGREGVGNVQGWISSFRFGNRY